MADRKDYIYAAVRKKMLDAVRTDLIGPMTVDEQLSEPPTSSYITGMLWPADTAMKIIMMLNSRTSNLMRMVNQWKLPFSRMNNQKSQ